ncbi:MAG: ornithine carbamoyltransferase [Pseudomonadota bacterium]
MKRDFIDLSHIEASDLRDILEDAKQRKAARSKKGKVVPDQDKPLDGRVLGLVFTKPSTRTRISFEVGMRQLGGQTIMLTGAEMQLGRGETVADTAKVLSRYLDAIMIRTYSHYDIQELAAHADIPVINGLTDLSHPCQIMADIMTFEEHKGSIKGKKIAWVGDGNNVCYSWIEAAVKFEFTLHIACPDELYPKETALNYAKQAGADVHIFSSVRDAVTGADCVTTDTWVSMGDEDVMRRHHMLKPYQVNSAIMSLADKDAIFMHCLPAHRGEEVTADVFDGPQSVVFDEAENRLHAQKGILAWCLQS